MEIDTWQVFVLISIILMISEIFLPSLILLPIGMGFLLSALFAPFITNTALLYLMTAICVGTVFLLFKKVFNGTQVKPPATAVDAMIGKQVIVMEQVTDSIAGNVKLYGDTWKALALDDGVEFKKDDLAIISKVEGNKVYIIKPN